jgi:hypothetical protein
LKNGLHERSIVDTGIDGIELPVATLRRMACEAHLLPAVLDGHGVVLDLGRRRRLANADQRRALRAMYPACAFPDCPVQFRHCDVHHVDAFTAQQGATNLDKLLPLCTKHHHHVHEGGLRLDLDPTTRDLAIIRLDGTVTHAPFHGRIVIDAA